MKRGLLIVFTIAVLGGLGLYVQKKPSDTLGEPAANSTPAANTTATSATAASSSPSASYKDGTYKGSATDTPYGMVQVAVVVSGGKITNVNFLQMPSDQGHSRDVTAFAEPLLRQSTIRAQTANIEFLSGATQTSEAYQQSLQAALNQAAVS